MRIMCLTMTRSISFHAIHFNSMGRYCQKHLCYLFYAMEGNNPLSPVIRCTAHSTDNNCVKMEHKNGRAKPLAPYKCQWRVAPSVDGWSHDLANKMQLSEFKREVSCVLCAAGLDGVTSKGLFPLRLRVALRGERNYLLITPKQPDIQTYKHTKHDKSSKHKRRHWEKLKNLYTRCSK